jgi:DnaK suppressor protein
MPRATRSTAKQSARGQSRTAASRKASTKSATKSATRRANSNRSAKTTTARRGAATKAAKRTRTASAPPPKTAARGRRATKPTKSTAKTAVKTSSRAVGKTTPKAPAKAPPKPAKPPAKRALKPEDKKFLQEQRVLLLAERDTYTQQAQNLKAEADQLAEDMEPGDIQFDEESGEGGTMNVERERDLALSAQAQAAVEEIDKALAKIAKGTYGYCEQCGQPIPKARLRALPYASLCVACKSGGLSRR